MKYSKGQVSMELLVIVGFVLAIFIPLVVAMYFKTTEINTSLEASRAQLAVSRIASLSNSMGNLGKESYIKAEIYVPKNVASISFRSSQRGGGEVVFKVRNAVGGINDIAESTKYPLKGTALTNPPAGLATFELSSDGTSIIVKKL